MSHARTDEARAYRKLYDTVAWQLLRLHHLQTEPLCRMCRKQRLVTAGRTVDHVIPHRGNTELFFDASNLQTLCDTHHNGAKQSFERTGHARGCDASGTPNDASSSWHEGRGVQVLPTPGPAAADDHSREKNQEKKQQLRGNPRKGTM